MAGMYRPTIREVSLPNGWHVPANNQGGLPAHCPVCTPAIDVCWLAMYVYADVCMALASLAIGINWFLEIFFPFFDFFF
jgi:hypothetical protein